VNGFVVFVYFDFSFLDFGCDFGAWLRVIRRRRVTILCQRFAWKDDGRDPTSRQSESGVDSGTTAVSGSGSVSSATGWGAARAVSPRVLGIREPVSATAGDATCGPSFAPSRSCEACGRQVFAG
jgi:hypothetical protein